MYLDRCVYYIYYFLSIWKCLSVIWILRSVRTRQSRFENKRSTKHKTSEKKLANCTGRTGSHNRPADGVVGRRPAARHSWPSRGRRRLRRRPKPPRPAPLFQIATAHPSRCGGAPDDGSHRPRIRRPPSVSRHVHTWSSACASLSCPSACVSSRAVRKSSENRSRGYYYYFFKFLLYPFSIISKNRFRRKQCPSPATWNPDPRTLETTRTPVRRYPRKFVFPFVLDIPFASVSAVTTTSSPSAASDCDAAYADMRRFLLVVAVLLLLADRRWNGCAAYPTSADASAGCDVAAHQFRSVGLYDTPPSRIDQGKTFNVGPHSPPSPLSVVFRVRSRNGSHMSATHFEPGHPV